MSRPTYRWINIFHSLYFILIPKKYKFLKLRHIAIMFFLFLLIMQITLFGGLKYYKIFTTPTPPFNAFHQLTVSNRPNEIVHNNSLFTLKIPSLSEFRQNIVNNKLKTLAKLSDYWDINKLLNNVAYPASPCKKVHIFYQISFSNLKIDGEWNKWNQEYNSEELKDEQSKLNLKLFKLPPEDIDSNFYPLSGCYSSRDPQIVKIHLKEIRDTGIGVLILPWKLDKTTEDTIDIIFNLAKSSQLKIAFHISTSLDQKPDTIFKNIQHLTAKYTYQQVYYKFLKNGRNLPVYYVFESYLTSALVWRQLLAPGSSSSIRGTHYDAVFIGLLRDNHHMYEIGRAHFDGFYTYYSSNGFSYGSSWKNWKSIKHYAKKYKLLFFPSVSPGYSTRTQVGQTRHRSAGRYYQVAWRAALAAGASGISITSFNDWQHGSQIEPAVAKSTYLDYRPNGPYFYLNLTRYWVDQFMFYDEKRHF